MTITTLTSLADRHLTGRGASSGGRSAEYRMQNIWSQSKGAARRALVLGFLASASIAFPIIWIFVLRFYGQGFGVFAVLYVVFAIPATASAFVASRRGEWWRPDGGKRFVCALYGMPILLIIIFGGLAMKR